MAYQSLYRKYRPQTFSDVVGQGHVVRTLQNAITSGRIAHGYLFTGTRGTAKTTIARLLAKALNCQSADSPVAEPCNQCDACRSITAGGNVDVVEMDAASHRGVADIEEVRKNVGYGPMELRYKVFIIDEAHQLSSDAKDAFLKTLEEPPPGVVFILATTEPQAIPITIRSRCQQFDFKRGSLAEISGRLKFVLDAEGVKYTDEAVALVARGAEGSYRDSLSLLEQVLAFSPESIDAAAVQTVLGTLDKETLAAVVDCVARRDAPSAFALAGHILDSGKEARTLIKTLAAHFRDLLLICVGGPAASAELTPDDIKTLQPQAARFDPGQLLRAIETLNESFSETRWNNQHRLLTELTFLKLMNLGDAPAAIATAPIVFSAPAPAHPPVAEAPPLFKQEKEETEAQMDAGYFADDDGDGADEGIEIEPEVLEPEVAEPMPLDDDLPPPPEEVEERESNDGMELLFDESELPAGALTGGTEPDPPVAPTPQPKVVAPPVERESPPYTLDDVQRAWPALLARAKEVSQKASVQLASAFPSAVEGRTIVCTFSSPSSHGMMNQPKQLEFVRKLLAMVLECGESVPVRFELREEDQTMAMKFERPAEKPKLHRDPLARLRALESEPAASHGPNNGNQRENIYAPPTAAPRVFERPAPPPTEPTPNPWAIRHDEPQRGPKEDPEAVAKRNAALAEPLVQDALEVFGGSIVVD